MVNPVINGANAFMIIWQALPLPIRAVFYVALILATVWALYQLLSN